LEYKLTALYQRLAGSIVMEFSGFVGGRRNYGRPA